MSKETTLTIAAQCDRAARDGTNEDNCLVMSEVGCANPSVNHFGDVTAESLSKMIPLRGKGCLLVVADGMGGMNAGEVASQIAVTTIAKCFSEENMKNLEMTELAIKKFLRKTIVFADNAIKKAAAKDREKEGMGTTVALLWLLENNTAYYAWCGDSRIYRYTTDDGLQTLSQDHSYVMEVLHLSEEEAFVHPNNNIITRSLGNPAEKANPDIVGPIEIYQDDLFLLCSDGLCGVLPSRKIDGDVSCIEDVIEEHIPDADHLVEGIDELWTAAAAAGWHDNVTTLLCQVKKGLQRPESKKKPAALQTNKSIMANTPKAKASSKASPLPQEKEVEKRRNRKDSIVALLVVVLIALLVVGGFWIFSQDKKMQDSKATKAKQGQILQKTETIPTTQKHSNIDNTPSGSTENNAKGASTKTNTSTTSQQSTLSHESAESEKQDNVNVESSDSKSDSSKVPDFKKNIPRTPSSQTQQNDSEMLKKAKKKQLKQNSSKPPYTEEF